MRPCEPCQVIRKHFRADPQVYRQHCPTCLHCGARLIQKLQRLYALTPDRKRAQCRAVLVQWVAIGHDEQALRQLAMGSGWAVAAA